MPDSTLPPSFHHPSARVLRGEVSVEFEQFYRERLRFKTGARLRCLDLARHYHQWAAPRLAPSLGPKAFKRLMMNVGHTHFTSDGAWFGDVVLAEVDPSISDNFPRPPCSDPSIVSDGQALLTQIDRCLVELAVLRASLAQR